jgi:hypothetical protein
MKNSTALGCGCSPRDIGRGVVGLPAHQRTAILHPGRIQSTRTLAEAMRTAILCGLCRDTFATATRWSGCATTAASIFSPRRFLGHGLCTTLRREQTCMKTIGNPITIVNDSFSLKKCSLAEFCTVNRRQNG